MIKKYNYLIVEDELSVFTAIEERMKPFNNWHAVSPSSNAFDAIDKLRKSTPELIFLDWHLTGSSGFDVLDYLLQQNEYKPSIIFMTGQLENPMQLTKTIINKYKNVDVFIDKPIWENLTNNLANYIRNAEEKAKQIFQTEIWIEDINGTKQKVDLNKIECILQHHNRRSKDIYLINNSNPYTVTLSWQECYDLLDTAKVDYFITHKRTHLVIKKFIEKYDKPIVRLKSFTACKIEVVKDSIKEFEKWLVEDTVQDMA